ncbi:MAG: S8 family serine peptidase [Canibacter sp.]
MSQHPQHPVFRAAAAVLGTALLASIFVLPAHGEEQAGEKPAEISSELTEAVSGKFSEEDGAWIDEENDTIEVIVYFEDDGVSTAAQGDPELAAQSLQNNADAHWDEVDTKLAEIPGTTVLNKFWITSSILVRAKNDPQTLEQLASLPGASQVLPNYDVEGLDDEEPDPVEEPTVPGKGEVTYGIETIGADDVWQDYGVKGEGVRVAVLDTGVDASHPDIADKLVGHDSGDPSYPGGWINFDRNGKPVTSKPTDPGSHGTHVAGTVLGGNTSGTQIGVAPNAELMAANVLSGGGSSAKIQAALQWVIAPYDGNGEPAGRAADVINMSLGSPGYDPSLIQALINIRDAGIFPAIAIGNDCSPNETSSPGNIYEAFGVGMTNSNNDVDPGSCGGITEWPEEISQQYHWPEEFVKPDASAPGVRVFSAMPGGMHGESTGTSMATPHVAGAVALLRSAQAGLTVDQIEQAFEDTADHPTPESAPDPKYGAGIIDVHAAIASVLQQSGVKGTVTDKDTGEPISGATVSFGSCDADECTDPAHGETWTTTETGEFTARVAPGEYAFTFTRFGFETPDAVHVTVPESGFVDLTAEMVAITTGTVSGTITDAASGEAVADATVTLMRQGTTATTNHDGVYTFEKLPIGSYEFKAEADGMRAEISDTAAVQRAQTTTVDFKLSPLKRVIVLGGPDTRTADLLNDNDFVTEFSETVPDNLGEYDVVVWDAPKGVDEATLNEAIATTDDAGTGIIWLDLGDSAESGIAKLSELANNPADRVGNSGRNVKSTAYEIEQPDHEIFAPGFVSPNPVSAGSTPEVTQTSNLSGRGFYASFGELTGENVQIIGKTVAYVPATDGACGEDQTLVNDDTCRIEAGNGIAVDERDNNRYTYLALNGSHQALSSREWTSDAIQVFLNAVNWTAAHPTDEEENPGSDIDEPNEPEEPKPGTIDPSPGPDPSRNQPRGSAAAQNPTLTGSAPATQTTSTTRKAPGAQTTPKPETQPKAPVTNPAQLIAGNSGDIKVRVEDGIAHVTIPDSEPGDWFFLHVYPGEVAVDWIRVNDDGELRIDISSLPDGTYKFAFTSEDGAFVGWVEVVAGDGGTKASAEQTISNQVQESAEAAPATTGGFQLSFAEQAMLLGCAILLLAAAGVVILAMRKPKA